MKKITQKTKDAQTERIKALIPTHPLEFSAWESCLKMTAQNPEAIECFKEMTGCDYSPPANGIEKLIDEATGHTADFTEQFLGWFNKQVWGPINQMFTS